MDGELKTLFLRASDLIEEFIVILDGKISFDLKMLTKITFS